jgi:hypothetical protein
MNNGYIKLYRQILDNPVVCKDSDHFAVWVYLLLNATHDSIDMLFNGKRITLQPGQLITGRKSIATKLNIDESKVRRIVNSFKIDQQIDQQKSNKNSLITILKWSSYQNSDQQNDQQVTNNRPTSDQQVTTNKNVKNVKNDKNDKKKSYGTHSNVLLSDDELTKLKEDYPNANIDDLVNWFSDYIAEKDYKSKSHNLAIRRWVVEAFSKSNNTKKNGRVEKITQYDVTQSTMTEQDEQSLRESLQNVN